MACLQIGDRRKDDWSTCVLAVGVIEGMSTSRFCSNVDVCLWWLTSRTKCQLALHVCKYRQRLSQLVWFVDLPQSRYRYWSHLETEGWRMCVIETDVKKWAIPWHEWRTDWCAIKQSLDCKWMLAKVTSLQPVRTYQMLQSLPLSNHKSRHSTN